MASKMLIDGVYPEEPRVVIVNNQVIEDWDYETSVKKLTKGNIYLGKVTRIESSLQAAFVDFGDGKQGFLPFSEIHPDYYHIPISDRPETEAEEGEAVMAEESAAAPQIVSEVTVEDEQEWVSKALPSIEIPNVEAAIAASAEEPPVTPHAVAFKAEFVYDETFRETAHPEGVISHDLSEGAAVRSDHITVADMPEPTSGLSHEVLEKVAVEDDVSQKPLSAEESQAPHDGRINAEAMHSHDETKVAEGELHDEAGVDDPDEANPSRPSPLYRRYKIQEVIKRNQVILVQVTKEERGNKGASLTSYISLAGRYCVLMPNSERQGGVSRRIVDYEDRRRLKDIIDSLDLKPGTSIIVRTAGSACGKAEIARDCEYLIRLWNSIREHTLSSKAPCFIHAEGDLIKRSIRDMYNAQIDEIIIQGEQAHKDAVNFMKMLVPAQANRIKAYKQRVPLFQRYRVEEQLSKLYQPNVPLESGGYIVINPTEALVSIDVNSGKSTSERNVEETALKTNLEAAFEIARQVRLRDLSGIIVIDFIDMMEVRHRIQVERAFKEALELDRAKIQLGRISVFGLLEMSRQRLRPNYVEANSVPCHTCQGAGVVRAPESLAMLILRSIEVELSQGECGMATIHASPAAILYMLNHKRKELATLEERYRVTLQFVQHNSEHGDHFTIQKTRNPHTVKERTSLTQLEVVDDLLPYEPSEEDKAMAEQSPRPASRNRSQQGRKRNWRKNASGEGATEGQEEAVPRHRRPARPDQRAEAGEAVTEMGANEVSETVAVNAEEGEAGERRSSRRHTRRRGNRRDRNFKKSQNGHAHTSDTAPERGAQSAAAAPSPLTGASTGGESLLKGLWKRITE